MICLVAHREERRRLERLREEVGQVVDGGDEGATEDVILDQEKRALKRHLRQVQEDAGRGRCGLPRPLRHVR